MSPKTGRPVKGLTKKELRLQLRLNHEEMELIDQCVKQSGMNRTEVVMAGVELVKKELDNKK